MKVLSVVGLTVGVFAAQTLFAGESAQYQNYRKTFLSTPVLEIPSQAAGLVMKVDAKDRATATVKIVNAAIESSPVSAPAIVASISRLDPSMASVAAATAAKAQPSSAALIAKAAAISAPVEAVAIAAQVSKAVPYQYAHVAVSVSQAVQSSSRDILFATANYAPAIVKADLETTTIPLTDSISVAGFLNSKSEYMAPAPTISTGWSSYNGSTPVVKNVVTGTTVAAPGPHGYATP